ncbi:T-complex protein 10 C-terminus [Dermatophagoides farinae]|uniref:T-complex protein 10 C-terminus n=1 Tax=Dermatophagoides farinae TaxID=6954 RepID=A0A922HRF6_DERFA|nr:T-complex protein 10 C-terminus [Dermatophagoides farinae]
MDNNDDCSTNIDSEDSFIEDANEQIRMLEHRIEQLCRLKDAIVEIVDDSVWPDGTTVVKFANGQMERLLPNGDKHVTYPDGIQAWIKRSDHSEQIQLVDGSTYSCYANGVQKRCYPNGDIEIKTSTYVKRKFASGKVKTVYSNGVQEILYNDGRLLFKDGCGQLIGENHLGMK